MELRLNLDIRASRTHLFVLCYLRTAPFVNYTVTSFLLIILNIYFLGEDLFDFLAECIQDFLVKNIDTETVQGKAFIEWELFHICLYVINQYKASG